MNTAGTSFFDGRHLTPFNISPHDPLDQYGQSSKDEWLSDEIFFQDHPVVMLCDGACI